MKRHRLSLALIALAALQPAAMAQFGGFDNDPPPPPWETFKMDAKARIKLDFRNANIDAVLQYLSQLSGVTIVKDPALTGGVTLQSPRPQSLVDAFAQLNAVLNLKNYEMVRDGNFLLIRPRQNRNGRGGGRGDATSGFGGGFPGGGAQFNPGVLRVYPIKYASASQVARVVNEVFANSGLEQQQQAAGGVPAPTAPAPGAPTPGRGPSPEPDDQGFGRGGGGFGGGAGGQGFGRGGGGFGGGGQGFGGGGFQRGNFGRGGRAGSVVLASADDYSNSVIVNAPFREQEQVGLLISQIDRQADQPQQARVFPLQYAVATDVVPLIQNVLTSNAPLGRGGSTVSQTPIDQRFGGRGGRGGTQSVFGTVVADQRTNALIVTATGENLVLVEKVIKELDKPVTFENSSFVITLENAKADQVANLLNQSFGGRVNGTTTNRTTGTTTRNTGTQNRNNQNQNRNNAGGAGGNRGPDGRNLMLDLDDPNAEEGELATHVTVQQPPTTRLQPTQGGGQTGLDSQGRVVNLRDLTGQVVAIPDVNTNSVIIVTSPENKALIEQILTQLDKIPEQVMIETLIVEASLDATSKLGFEWTFTNNKIFGTKGNGVGGIAFGAKADETQPQGLRYTLSGSQYSSFLTAVQSDSRFDVLSTPRIFTSNNATAEINISQSLPYVLSSRADVNGNLLYTYAFLDVGIILTVTPRITSNGYVTMDVTQTANDFVRYTEFNAPVVNQREAQTTVSVKDGETVVLGGILRSTVQSTVNKVPLLGDIPLLGNLFKSNSTTKNKTELLVFLTPRIVRSDSEARKVREDTESKMAPSTQKRLQDYRAAGNSGAEPKDGEKPKEGQKPGETPAPNGTPAAPPAPAQPAPAQPAPTTKP